MLDKVEELIEKLRSISVDDRAHAAQALGEIGDARAIGPLIAALWHNHCAITLYYHKISFELTRITNIDIDTLRYDIEINTVIDELKRNYVQGFPPITKGSPPLSKNSIRSILSDVRAQRPDCNWHLLRPIAKAIGNIRDLRSIEPLIAILNHDSIAAYIKAGAAAALGEIKDTRAVEPLIAALQAHDWEVRSFAAEALGKIKDARALQPLIAFLRDIEGACLENGDGRRISPVCINAAWALGEIGDVRAGKALINVLEERQVGRYAAEALGKIGEVKAVKPLIAALSYKNLHRWNAIIESLNKLDPAWSRSEEAQIQVPELIMALTYENNYIWHCAVETLTKIDPHWPQSEAIRNHIPGFIRALKDKDSNTRGIALEILNKIDPALATK